MVEYIGEFDRADALATADERFGELLSAGVPLD
jgi:hypothetical protein